MSITPATFATRDQWNMKEKASPSYVLITPARNEEQLLEGTIQSVIKQTIQPVKWVIVSDGSTDGTDELVARYARDYAWIELVTLPAKKERHFAAKVHAFNAGYEKVRDADWSVIGNVDADVSFDDDRYFEFVLDKFSENPQLGVAGTAYREGDVLYPYRYTSLEDVAGACQLFRRQCFQDIGGYVALPSGGIDVIAVFSAQTHGWQTRTFTDKTFEHHRKVGSGQHRGMAARLFHSGAKDRALGSHPLWEFLRCIYQMKNRPYLMGGALTLAGYVWAMLKGDEKTIPKELLQVRQKGQMQRLKQGLRRVF
jgi:poly-beta-1,6-N-acetyl-D-glucosamine synthase